MSKEDEIHIGPSIKVKPSSNEVRVDWTKLGYNENTLNSITSEGTTVREQMDQFTSKLVHAVTKEEATAIGVNEFVHGADAHMQRVWDATGVADIVKDELKKRVGNSVSQVSSLAARPVVLQGGIRPSTGGLHTLTAAEIIANGQKLDPTQPYFDTNSDHGRMINPLEPHYDLSGDFPKLVNPLKPGPKISNLG